MKEQSAVSQTTLSRRMPLIAASLLTSMVLLIAVFASFYTVAAGPVEPPGPAQRAPLANELHGIVVQPDGSPILEATLVHLSRPDEWGNCCWEITNTIATAGTGEFNFDLALVDPAFFPGDFYVIADGYSSYFSSLPQYIFLNSTAAVEVGPITLTYASFAGTVHDPNMIPMAQYGSVTIRDFHTGEWRESAWGEYTPGGAYAIGSVPSGNLLLEAHPPEDSILWHSEPISVFVAPGHQYVSTATQVIDLMLRQPNISGTVVYPNGMPVTWITSTRSTIDGSAWVKAVKDDFTVEFYRQTASSGDFGLLLPEEEFSVWAMPVGTLAQQYTPAIPRTVFGSVIPYSIGAVTLTYPSVSGFIYDALENPAPECLSVWLETQDTSEVVADQWYCYDGHPYLLGGVAAGHYWLKTAGLPHLGLFAPAPISITVAPGSQYEIGATQPVSIYLEAPQLEVTVHLPDDTIAEATVLLWDEMGYSETQPAGPGAPAQFGNLPYGTYKVRAWPVGADMATLAASPLQILYLDDTPKSIHLWLRDGNVFGTVHTPENDPLPQVFDWSGDPLDNPANVHVRSADWSAEEWTTTNISGEFSLALAPGKTYILHGLPAGQLIMTYTKSLPNGFALTSSGISLGSVRLTYPRTRGVVLDPHGSPYATPVQVWNEAGTYWEEEPVLWYGPERGEQFQIGGLPAGTYYLQAGQPPDNPNNYGASEIVSFTVDASTQYTPGFTEFFTLHLQTANVLGTVRYPAIAPCPDCPVPGVDVRIRAFDWSYEAWAKTDDDGQFVFSGLPVGDYWLEAFLGGNVLFDWQAPPAEYVQILDPTDQLSYTLYLDPVTHNKRVWGGVVDQYGSPITDENGDALGDARVYAYQQETGYRVDVETDPAGLYDLYLHGGEWIVGVEPNRPGVNWTFDRSAEQIVTFALDEMSEQQYLVFTVTRATFYTVTGTVWDPTNAPPPADSTWVALCTDEGHCFGDVVLPDGTFTLHTPPGPYRFWLWVDPVTGLLPPPDNGFPLVVRNSLGLGILSLRSTADRTVNLGGRVVISATGIGAGGVNVAAWTDEGDRTGALTD
ncbi:MAG: carboxypeptidase regulatory-like domain-containing protein, partial [Anaerolineae bacterium]|nr:carboxypeptidase regulatory-like domain-containing protein [Anaerolineae bacterium]